MYNCSLTHVTEEFMGVKVKGGCVIITETTDGQTVDGLHVPTWDSLLNFYHPWTTAECGGVIKTNSSTWTVKTLVH